MCESYDDWDSASPCDVPRLRPISRSAPADAFVPPNDDDDDDDDDDVDEGVDRESAVKLNASLGKCCACALVLLVLVLPLALALLGSFVSGRDLFRKMSMMPPTDESCDW